MTINEQTKQTTNEYLDKIKELELRTKSDLDFLVDGAIKSAKLEIALCEMTNYDSNKMSELAQNIQKYPNFEFDKQVVFGEYIPKSSMVTADFKLVDEEELNGQNVDSEQNQKAEEIVKTVKERKKHSQVRRPKIPVVSLKLDDCEVFVSVARLTQLDEKRKTPKKDCQKCLEDFTK